MALRREIRASGQNRRPGQDKGQREAHGLRMSINTHTGISSRTGRRSCVNGGALTFQTGYLSPSLTRQAWQTCPEVKSAITLLIDEELWGFVTPAIDGTDNVGLATAQSQPYYAVPSHYLTMDHFPLTPCVF